MSTKRVKGKTAAAIRSTMKYLSKHYFRALVNLLVMLFLQCLCLAPALMPVLGDRLPFLETVPSWLWYALSACLCLFFLVPWRFSLAAGIYRSMVEQSKGRRFTLSDMLSLRGYGKRWEYILSQVLRGMPWLLFPVAGIALLILALYQQGGAEIFTKSLPELASTLLIMAKGVGQIFGPGPRYVEGMALMVGLIALLFFVLAYGLKRGGMYRYLYRLDRTAAAVRKKEKCRLRGNRWGQLGIMLIQLLCWLPVVLLGFYLLDTRVSIMKLLFPGAVLLAPPLPLLICGVVVYLLLMPFRKVLSAAYIKEAE